MSMYRNYSTRSDCPDEFLDLMSDHMSAMTTEDLHSKGDIARELAWRDYKIAKLKAVVEALKPHSKRFGSEFNIGLGQWECVYCDSEEFHEDDCRVTELREVLKELDHVL